MIVYFLFNLIKSTSEECKNNVSPLESNIGKKDEDRFIFIPGYPSDYEEIKNAISKILICETCCTCKRNKPCLFLIYTKLCILLGKYNEWVPVSLLDSKLTEKRDISDLKDIGLIFRISLKNRCNKCNICKQMSYDIKIKTICRYFFNIVEEANLLYYEEEDDEEFYKLYLNI